LIRSKHDRRSTWDPLRDTHRGRVTAILLILAEDPVPGDPTSIPLFLNPQTGLEITYNESREALERILRDSGFGSLGKN